MKTRVALSLAMASSLSSCTTYVVIDHEGPDAGPGTTDATYVPGDDAGVRLDGGTTDPSLDTDGDGLSDLDEATLGTSAILADTDGDGLSDGQEVIELGFLPENNNYRFNPRIADTPRFLVELTSVPRIGLNLETSSGTSTSVSTERSTESARTLTTSQTETTSYAFEVAVELGVEAMVSPTPGVTLSASLTTTFSAENQLSFTAEQAEENRQALSRAEETASETSSTVSSGFLATALRVTNDGDLTFGIDSMLLSVVTADPHDAGRVIPIGNLSLDTSLEFPAFALAPGEATADLVFVNRELDQAIVRDLLADSSGLLVRVAAVTLRDASGRPFAFDRTAIDARTASIVIDYAGRESTESYRVATSVDRETLRLPLRAALTDILRIPFETNASGGLTTVRGVAEDASIEAHWVGLLVTTDGRVERYVPLDEASSIDTLELKSGDTLRLVYLEDADHDGLGAREELIVGTDPTQADTDGDGLEDGAEVRPGFTHRVTTPDGTSDVLTFTDPRRADTDGDSLSDQAETSRSPAIDPTRADTDGDGVRDPDDYAPDVFQTLAATLTPRTGTTATTASVDYALPAVGGPIQYAIVRAFQGATSFDLAALPDDGATLSMSATLRCTDDTDCFTVVATGSAGGLSPTTGTVADTFPSKSGGTTIRYVALLRVGNQWLRVGSARTTVPSPAPDHRLQVRVTGGTLTCWDGNFDTSCELYWRFLVDGAVIAGGVPETSPVAVTSPSLGGMPFGPGFLVPPSAYSPTFTAAEITGRCFTLTIELYDADDGNTATTAGDPRASHDRIYCWDPARSSYYGTELADDERWDFALSTSGGHGTDLGTRGTLSWDLRTEP